MSTVTSRVEPESEQIRSQRERGARHGIDTQAREKGDERLDDKPPSTDSDPHLTAKEITVDHRAHLEAGHGFRDPTTAPHRDRDIRSPLRITDTEPVLTSHNAAARMPLRPHGQ
ncbi:hypothetical protein [Streptomyces sp. NPDC058683]|uniref:hypothetical protein n=1 Tax=Streptomyces sp. NPDC058683 TaxID=3346597 RepID=UPI003654B938